MAIENEIKVVFASSASVYGDVKNIPIKETNLLNPINPYGETKLEIEKISSSLKNDGLKAIGLRYFNVFGEGQSSAYAGVITKFFQNLKKGIQPVIFGNGLQIRDFIFVEDVVNANLSAMNKIDSGIFNIGSGQGIQILDLANYMINSFGFDFSPIFEPALKNDIKQSVADINLVQETIDWNPKITIHDWIDANV